MKIKEVHIFQKDLPVKDGPYTMAGQVVHKLDSTIIKLVADNGLIGWGEVCPLGPLYAPVHAEGVRSALRTLCDVIVGAEAAPLVVRQKLNATMLGENYAKAAIDIALYDLLGKHLGVPVSTLLGGALVDHVPSYFATGIGDPDEIARLAKSKVEEGFRRIQIKAGGRLIEEDIATVRKIWELIGHQAKLVVDANRGFNASDTLRLSSECSDIPITLEQPCDTIEEVSGIRNQISHPLYFDESMVDINSVLRVIGEGLVNGFGMKISRIGGLQSFSTFRDICAARNLPHTCDDSWGGDIVAAACVQAGATVKPELLEGVWVATGYIDETYAPDNPVVVKDGRICLPQGPGLGIEIDETVFGNPIASF